jgi:predicted Zn-dependent peptidase
MPERKNEIYYMADVLSDALGRDKSSRLYISLKKEQKLVSEIGAYITGSMDQGLLVISGKLNDGVSFENLDKALWKELDKIQTHPISQEELDRLMIKIRTSKEFQEQGLLNRAMNLCLYELLGDANGVNEENALYQQITSEHILKIAQIVLRKENCSLLRVKAITND